MTAEAKGASHFLSEDITMTYDLTPHVTRMTPFRSDGSGLAAVQIGFGPISVAGILCKNANGYFLSLPRRHSETHEKWYDLVTVGDTSLKKLAEAKAIAHYERVAEGELVAV